VIFSLLHRDFRTALDILESVKGEKHLTERFLLAPL